MAPKPEAPVKEVAEEVVVKAKPVAKPKKEKATPFGTRDE